MRLSLPAFVWMVVVIGVVVVATLGGYVSLTPSVLLILLLCFGCELMDSSLGMGFGTTLAPVLLLAGFEPHQLVPTILVSEFLSGFASFFFHAEEGNVTLKRGSTHLRAAVMLSLLSLVGVLVGVELALSVSKVALTRIIGVIILTAGVVLMMTQGRHYSFRLWKIGLLGLVASFNKALSGGGYGPLMTSGQLLSGVEGRAAVGITSFAEGFTCLAASALYLSHGQELDTELMLPVVCGAALSIPFSARIVKLVHEELMRRLIAVFTVALGVLALAKTFF